MPRLAYAIGGEPVARSSRFAAFLFRGFETIIGSPASSRPPRGQIVRKLVALLHRLLLAKSRKTFIRI